MGLSFTSIKDKPGAAIYFLHDGTTTQQRLLERIAQEVHDRAPTYQMVMLSGRDRDGDGIRDFYSLDPDNFPHILVVSDDDQVVQSWSGQTLPTSDQLSYAMQASGTANI